MSLKRTTAYKDDRGHTKKQNNTTSQCTTNEQTYKVNHNSIRLENRRHALRKRHPRPAIIRQIAPDNNVRNAIVLHRVQRAPPQRRDIDVDRYPVGKNAIAIIALDVASGQRQHLGIGIGGDDGGRSEFRGGDAGEGGAAAEFEDRFVLE